MVFSGKKNKDIKMKLYRNNLERVESFRFLGVWFDSRLTWRSHVKQVEDKCKKIINIMRCLTGVEWGADFKSLKYICLWRNAFEPKTEAAAILD